MLGNEIYISLVVRALTQYGKEQGFSSLLENVSTPI